jgi:hypothetical protein
MPNRCDTCRWWGAAVPGRAARPCMYPLPPLPEYLCEVDTDLELQMRRPEYGDQCAIWEQKETGDAE